MTEYVETIDLIRIAGVRVRATEPVRKVKGMAWLDTSITALGGLLAVTTKTADYTAVSTDSVILVDATGGAVTITLPTAVGISGKAFYIKRLNAGANTVTVDANAAETVDDGLTAVLTVQYEAITIVSDNVEWWIV